MSDPPPTSTIRALTEAVTAASMEKLLLIVLVGAVVGYGWIAIDYLSDVSNNQSRLLTDIATKMQQDATASELTRKKFYALLDHRLIQLESRVNRIENAVSSRTANPGQN